MLIECPFCKATAKRPEDKEGAKVRCSECSKVYVAREKGSKVKKSSVNGTSLGIAGGAVILIGIFAFFANQHDSKPAPTPKPPPVKEPELVIDHVGWDSELVKFVRNLYDAAASYNEGMLISSIDGARFAAHLATLQPLAEGEDPAAQAAAAAADFAELGPAKQQDYVLAIAQEFMRGTDDNSPHFWKPVEGRVLEPDLLSATVRVTVDKRPEEGQKGIAESRTYDWHLSRASQQTKWKIWAWERYMSDAERRALAASKKVKTTRVTLEDGTSLYQAEMHHLEHLEDTPAEVRAQIEKLIPVMLDFTLRPKENNVARDELVAIGKPAIPMLLNQFYEIKIIDTMDDPSLTQVNMVYDTLKQITGYAPGFSPLPGQSEERRTMALKAYFAWWERNGKKFTAPKEQKDLLEDLIVPTEREKREIEKAKSGG
jgi:hypothetical protein